ncbi:hypothetical protein [Hydrogenivirga sp. 128-5-R1-1]|uniref:hypothetical protein n=1 Tax=Hydrogenivirga sp. 128-5-R1-1 TaxID=392423 RepID=UPI00015EF0B5|nr:hypothetical protein [Hydrogenivirga sp. 128-5-R1-1]EDP74721.1 VCBS [Hydrogenivirga sp. 128-5-R1-1]
MRVSIRAVFSLGIFVLTATCGGGGGGGSSSPTFGNNGVVIHNNAAGGNSEDVGSSIIIDGQGKILVTGHSKNANFNEDMVIWRFSSNGTLDNSFGNNGVVVHNNAAGGNSSDRGNSIAIDGNGRIIITGTSFNGNNNDMVIWRYNSDGTLDISFGNNGFVVHNNAAGGNSHDWGFSVTTDSQNKVLVTGTSHNANNNYDMVIWRYNSNGTLDNSFGNNGIVVHDNAAGGNGDDIGSSIVVDSNGKIVVAGYSSNGSNNDMVIWRYNSDGTLDNSFGNSGIVVHNNAAGGNSDDVGVSIVVDNQGRILITGSSKNSNGDRDMAVWRYNPNGTLDNTFGNNGIVVRNNAAGGDGNDHGSSIWVDNGGNVFVTGYSINGSGDNDMVIWKVYP